MNDEESDSYYNILNKKIITKKFDELLSQNSVQSSDILNVFLDILQNLKDEELGHINKSLTKNDLRAASICNETLGAYQTLYSMLTRED